ncbi:hypothetical protein [Dolichospermum flos-aquae]|uniref:Uncharacterized protein n=1 Tax=Dolichospermum flos-aquae CCAP 1403/13F TaxID=315271 RepID=A0A6H2C341_DOLFA|nr:hypothetical protein [Dolichospermum flos-aquae]QJB45369.1 hypothetical protein HGD76_15505 [Dolichospermum flos-aquae CCAP 1403/13F]
MSVVSGQLSGKKQQVIGKINISSPASPASPTSPTSPTSHFPCLSAPQSRNMGR